MVGLSTKKSPLAGMGFAQKIATVVLGVLALVALVAVLAHGGRSSSSSSGGRSTGSTASAGGVTASGSDRAASTRHGGSRGTPSAAADAGTGSSGTGSDGLAATTVDQLPPQAAATLKLIDAGGPFPYSRDGIVFSNVERILPKHPRGWYHEYTVKTPGESDRGARRLIKGQDGTIYYTGDHYATFKRVTR